MSNSLIFPIKNCPNCGNTSFATSVPCHGTMMMTFDNNGSLVYSKQATLHVNAKKLSKNWYCSTCERFVFTSDEVKTTV